MFHWFGLTHAGLGQITGRLSVVRRASTLKQSVHGLGNPKEERDDMTESQIQVQSASQVQAAPSGLYNFNLSLSGQLQLAGQETDTIQETENEIIQTS